MSASGPEMRRPLLVTADGWDDYALLDSGAGRKLERYGRYTVIRPEPQALWRPVLDDAAWQAADAWFEGGEDTASRWSFRGQPAAAWTLCYGDVAFEAQFTPFRHLGVFPEQAAQWDFLRPRLEARAADGRTVKVLNLFAYTGVASLIAAKAGAQVTHLDASKKAITWANRNQSLSGLEAAPIRWIADDALKFLRREVKRGHRYDAVLLDPPKYGRGTKGEVWDLYRDLPELLSLAVQVLDDDPLALIATVYAIRLSGASLHEGVAEALADAGVTGGVLESGEMGLRDGGGRVLSNAIFSRWAAA